MPKKVQMSGNEAVANALRQINPDVFPMFPITPSTEIPQYFANYVSNDDAEINHDELLKKLNINNDDLKEKISFDVILKLESGKTFKSNIKLELPIDNVVENGTQSKEYADLKEIVFKRINE